MIGGVRAIDAATNVYPHSVAVAATALTIRPRLTAAVLTTGPSLVKIAMTEEVGTPDPIYQRGMTRGALVAGGATLAGAVAATTASAAPVGTAVVAGFIESIDRSGSVTIRTIERVVDVRLESTAEFWRDHPVDIAAFDIGDEVAAEGSWTQEGFVASALFGVFRPISGTVTARRGDQLLIGSTQQDDKR
jgi:hypothetical protein